MQKIILLEKQVGAKTGYQILEPFSLNSTDAIAIQIAAKKIAKFIGMNDYIFIIATAKQKENVGGHIELNYGEKKVFVEISDNTLKFNDAILATLAHEITHKYLHINGISCGINSIHKYENEVLTDIAAAFLGLGKLMLNGCECKNVRQESVPNGTKTITNTLKTGYLVRNQLAFAYRLICAMRKIPSSDYERGLSPDSIRSLRDCERDYGDYFDNRFHEPDAKKRSLEYLQSEISNIQSILFNIDKNLLYIQEACVKFVEIFLGKTHKELRVLFVDAQNIAADDNEYDPCLKFLKSKQFDLSIKNLVFEISKYSSESYQYQKSVTKLTNDMQTIGNLFPKPSSDMFTIVTCRNDGTKLRLPADKDHLIAQCPKCQYQFVADTSIPLSKEVHNIKKDSLLKNIFKSLFMRK
jgi:hypothetical protein